MIALAGNRQTEPSKGAHGRTYQAGEKDRRTGDADQKPQEKQHAVHCGWSLAGSHDGSWVGRPEVYRCRTRPARVLDVTEGELLAAARVMPS